MVGVLWAEELATTVFVPVHLVVRVPTRGVAMRFVVTVAAWVRSPVGGLRTDSGLCAAMAPGSVVAA